MRLNSGAIVITTAEQARWKPWHLRMLVLSFAAVAGVAAVYGLHGLSSGARVEARCVSRIEPDVRRKPNESDMPFTTIDRGSLSGIKSSERMAIRDTTAWMSVWKRHTSGNLVSRTPPHIDFDHCMVLAVFQGESAKAGLIGIDRVRKLKDKVVVSTSVEQDGVGSSSIRTSTRSFHIVRTARNSLPVIFR